MSRFTKRSLVALGALFVVVQFYRPPRTNPPVDPAQRIDAHVAVPPPAVLQRSCRDCHSNETVWPWYSNVAPISWFVIDHVDHARSHLNFSEWGREDASRREELLRNICDWTKDRRMPLPSYLWMHRGAALLPGEGIALCTWTADVR